MNSKNLFKKTISLRQFLFTINEFQKLYFDCEKDLNTTGITASQIEFFYNKQNKIATDLTKYILDKNLTVEIFNKILLDKDK
jgi:hypothetical protein